MSENLYKKIEELYLLGRITKDEKEALLKALDNKEETTNSISQIQINVKLCDLEIVGREDIHYPKFEQGSLKIIRDGNILRLEDCLNFNSVVRILVPFNSNILIKSVSSDISVVSVLGFLQIQSVSSDVQISDVSDRIIISLISGDVETTNLHGKLNITTKSGDIKINKSKVSAVLKTYSGDIVANDTEFNDSRFNTFNGDITLKDALFLNKNSINTYFGDVSIEVIGEVLINASSSMGNVSNKYHASFQETSNELSIDTKFGDIEIEGKET